MAAVPRPERVETSKEAGSTVIRNERTSSHYTHLKSNSRHAPHTCDSQVLMQELTLGGDYANMLSPAELEGIDVYAKLDASCTTYNQEQQVSSRAEGMKGLS